MVDGALAEGEQVGQCGVDGCDEPGPWGWWNGMGLFAPYCDEHAREQLKSDPEAYVDPITWAEDVGDVGVVSAGIRPREARFPTIRTKEAFDLYLESDGDGPRMCSVFWCGELDRDCGGHEERGQRA